MLATDKLGSTSWTAVAEAFGATGVLQGSSIAMNLRFPGQYWDGETGNHYNFHRDYKAGMGRYLEGDPIGLDGGINFFIYVSANPMTKRDSFGLTEDCDCKDPPPSKPNGCGGQGSSFKPDEFNPFQNIFEKCCNAHDICYGTCKGPNKADCDNRFLLCMIRTCRKQIKNGLPAMTACSYIAFGYYEAVVQVGFLFFDRSNCCNHR